MNLLDSTKPRGPPVSTSLSILKADSRVVPQRLPDLFPRGVLFFVRKTARKYTGTGPRTAPRGAGSFHVGGSRVPGPNTFLIEMFIERLQRIIGKQFR